MSNAQATGSTAAFKNATKCRRGQIVASENIATVAADNTVKVGVSLVVANPFKRCHLRISRFTWV